MDGWVLNQFKFVGGRSFSSLEVFACFQGQAVTVGTKPGDLTSAYARDYGSVPKGFASMNIRKMHFNSGQLSG